ncbi:MAG: hypothetical protein ABEK59_07470 [Halobacteria archaeon]
MSQETNATKIVEIVTQKLKETAQREAPRTYPRIPLAKAPVFCIGYEPENREFYLRTHYRPLRKPVSRGKLFEVPLRFQKGDDIESRIQGCLETIAQRVACVKGPEERDRLERKLAEQREESREHKF